MDVIGKIIFQYINDDLFVGIVSGIISGIIVDIGSKIYRYNKAFAEEQQLYIRWLDKIIICLDQAYDKNDFTIVLWTIADEPIRESFTYLKSAYVSSVEDIQCLINEIKYVIIQNRSITKQDIGKFKNRLVNYKCHILDYKHMGFIKRTMYRIKKKNIITYI